MPDRTGAWFPWRGHISHIAEPPAWRVPRKICRLSAWGSRDRSRGALVFLASVHLHPGMRKAPRDCSHEALCICKRYQSGDSVYKLAEDFGCHRSTISAVLKRNGVEVSHKASTKPELVKRVIELYAEMKTPKEVGAIVGLDCGTVRQVLKENGIYIRKSWEYPKNK